MNDTQAVRKAGTGLPDLVGAPPRSVTGTATFGGLKLLGRRPALTVCLAAALYSWVITFPLIFQMDRSIYGYPGDATGTVAIYSWWSYALTHHQSIFDNTAWGAPYGAGWRSTVWSLLPVLVLAPLAALMGGTAAYNVEVLSSFPLTAWATFLLVRRLGCRPLAAAFSAFAFTFVPYHLEKAQGHAGQTHMEFFSGTLLFLVRWRQGGSRWNLVVAGGLAGMTLWDDYYFAFITLFLVAAFFLASLAWSARGGPLREIARHLVAGFIVAIVAASFALAAVALAVRASPVAGAGSAISAQTTGLHHGLDELYIYSARKRDYVLPYFANPLLPRSLQEYERSRLHGSNFTEQSLFVGYTVLALAAVGTLAAWRRWGVLLSLTFGTVGFLVAEPPGLHRLGPLLIPTPSLLLNPFLPVFRVYSRFGVLVLLAAATLAGFGFSFLQERLHGRSAALLAAPFLLTALEFNNIPPFHVTQLYPPPAEYRWLAAQPAGILIEYPLKSGSAPTQEVQTRQYTLYQHMHKHPIFNGATASSRADQISADLEPYYGSGVAAQLHAIGIRYVFVHRQDYRANSLGTPQDVMGLEYVDTLHDTDIYRVP